MATQQDLDKRQSIKQAARDLFFRFGFNKTSIEDIARHCGMAKASLYYYYPNKDALFNEIVIEEADQFMNQVEAKLPKHAPPDEKLAWFFRLIYQDLKVYAREMAEVPEIMCEHSPHGRPIVEKINQMFQDKLRPLLQAGKTAGIFDYRDEDVVVASIAYMTQFLNLEWMQMYPEALRDAVIETTIDILLNGIRRR